ncbi:MAG: hypothetical protein Q9163_002616 [Psora crenata]
MAIGNANMLASEQVGAIIALLDPPQTKGTSLADLVTALASGLEISWSPASKFKEAVLTLLKQEPPAAKYIYPVGTAESQLSQSQTITNDLSTIVQWYQSNVSQIIPTINNNVETFIAFASSGAFSVNPLPDLSHESNNLLKGLTTYVLSKALKLNNIFLTRALNTSVDHLQRNLSDQLSFPTACGQGYDEDGVCSTYWYDNRTDTTYALNSRSDMRKNFHELMKTMFGNWTSGDLLFAGAARCAARGGYTDGQLASTIIRDGRVNVDCLSSLQVCTWEMNSLDYEREFTDCPAQKGYITNGCRGQNSCTDDSGLRAINVPRGYLGTYLLNPGFFNCVCNT